ncbi:MAG: hypothetical protein ACFCBW_18595 [Candidatus Competibacterales bacterium]
MNDTIASAFGVLLLATLWVLPAKAQLDAPPSPRPSTAAQATPSLEDDPAPTKPPTPEELAAWMSQITARVSDLETANAALEDRVAELTTRNQTLSGHVERANTRHASALERLADVEAGNAQLRAQAAELETENFILQMQLIEMERVEGELLARIDDLDDRQTSVNTRLNHLYGLSNGLRSDLVRQRQTSGELHQRLDELQGQNTTLRRQVVHLDAGEDAMEKRIDDLTRQSDDDFQILDQRLEALALSLDQLDESNLVLQNRYDALGSNLACLSADSNATQMIFEGCNVWVRNGTGATDTANGLGNLIIGYNEAFTTPPNELDKSRTGSHNLVIGDDHHYTSVAGVVTGLSNTISGPYASIVGGSYNAASGPFANVTGGSDNLAAGEYTSIVGGAANHAADHQTTITGGRGYTIKSSQYPLPVQRHEGDGRNPAP